MDVQSVENNPKMALKIASRNVRKHQRKPARQNSPLVVETEMAKGPRRWGHIRDDGNDAYAPQNAPIARETEGSSLDQLVRNWS